VAQVDKSFTLSSWAEFHSSWILLVIALVVGPLLKALLSTMGRVDDMWTPQAGGVKRKLETSMPMEDGLDFRVIPLKLQRGALGCFLEEFLMEEGLDKVQSQEPPWS